MIELGTSATISFTVDGSATAIALGSGDLPVLGTPKVVALVEEAAIAAIAGRLADKDTTVGSHIAVDHLAPTLLGSEVAATSTVFAIAGPKIEFKATVTEDGKLVAQGTHTRVVVDRKLFMEPTAD